MSLPLITQLWKAWGPDGWEADAAAIVRDVRIINHLAETISLIEYAQRRAAVVGVPAWREPWFPECLRLLDAEFERRCGPLEPPAGGAA